jgi:ketosteroid isomerase-like protein
MAEVAEKAGDEKERPRGVAGTIWVLERTQDREHGRARPAHRHDRRLRRRADPVLEVRPYRRLTPAAAGCKDGRMHTDDPVLDLMDRFTAALNSHDLDATMALVTDDIVFESTSPPPDGTRYEGRDAVLQVWGEMLASTPQARFSVEEQFSDGSGRAVVRWRYDWADGHVRGVDVVRVRNGQLAESLAYVKG